MNSIDHTEKFSAYKCKKIQSQSKSQRIVGSETSTHTTSRMSRTALKWIVLDDHVKHDAVQNEYQNEPEIVPVLQCSL